MHDFFLTFSWLLHDFSWLSHNFSWLSNFALVFHNVNRFRFFLIVHAERGFIEKGVFNHRLFNSSFTIMTVMFGLFGYLPYIIGGIFKSDKIYKSPVVSYKIINRPDIAGAVLQAVLRLIRSRNNQNSDCRKTQIGTKLN